MVSGAVIAACAGVVAAAELSTGSDLMNKVETQQNKPTEKEQKAKDLIKKKDKAKESIKKKKMKVKEIKESKAKPTKKLSTATDEGAKTVQEMKDMKKELK